MIDLNRLSAETLTDIPYRWAFIQGVFSQTDANDLAASFPTDHFKTVAGDDGEKAYL